MRLFHRVIPYLVSNSNIYINRCCYPSDHLLLIAKLFHTDDVHPPQNGDSVVARFCDAFRQGWSWNTLNKRFNSVELNISVVEGVLLHLKEPIDAKRALGFFHWSSQSKGFQHEVRTYSIAIHIMVHAHMLSDSRALLESILRKSVEYPSRFCVVDSLLSTYTIAGSRPLVFDLLVQQYSKLRMFEVAFDVCCYLEEHGFSVSLISFNTLIHLVGKSEMFVLVWNIYERMLQQRTYPNEATIKSLITALCKEGKLDKYIDILDRIHGKRCLPSVIVNTCLIFRVLEAGKIDNGMMLLRRMLQRNMILDTVSYTLIVYAKVKFETLDAAWEVYGEMVKRGFRANPFVYTLFIGAHCAEGRIEEANSLMQELENIGLRPYDDTFNHLIMGCSRAGKPQQGLEFCEKMINMGLMPSCSAVNEMLGKLCVAGCVAQANALLTVLLDKGFSPNEHIYAHLIEGYGREALVQEVLKLYYEMEYRSISLGSVAFETLIRNLCRCGEVGVAEKYKKIMKDQKLAPRAAIYELPISSSFSEC